MKPRAGAHWLQGHAAESRFLRAVVSTIRLRGEGSDGCPSKPLYGVLKVTF
jgi:hypothetical protein